MPLSVLLRFPGLRYRSVVPLPPALPTRVTLAAARGAAAFNAAVSPAMSFGAYWTVTLQVWLGRSAVPEQPLLVMKKKADDFRVTAICPEDLPPVLLSVKICDAVWPGKTNPKSYWPLGDQVSAGVRVVA